MAVNDRSLLSYPGFPDLEIVKGSEVIERRPLRAVVTQAKQLPPLERWLILNDAMLLMVVLIVVYNGTRRRLRRPVNLGAAQGV